jgi:hypothetical protein
MLQLNAHQRTVVFQNQTVSHFPILSHGLSLNTATNALTQALQNVNKRKNFQYSRRKQILFLNIFVFQSFFPPPVYRQLSVVGSSERGIEPLKM